MEFIYEYIALPKLMIALTAINVLCFFVTAVIAAFEHAQSTKFIAGYVIATIALFAGIAIFDSITAMMISIIFEMVIMLFTCVAALVVIGFILLGLLVVYLDKMIKSRPKKITYEKGAL